MRALLILNGDYAGGDLLSSLSSEADIVICADGGVRHAITAGIKVDMLLGDMDSFSGDAPNGSAFVEYPREKDLTDGELALDTAIEKGADFITIVCAGGGRPDHLYGNMLLIQRAVQKGIDCRMIAGQFEIILAAGKYSSKTAPGKIFSVLPFKGDFTYIQNKGLLYHIDNPVHVKAHECFGISNVATNDFIEIHIEKGCALIFREL